MGSAQHPALNPLGVLFGPESVFRFCEVGL
jgi:hypothetical protein